MSELKKFCNCEVIGGVARDGFSTCMKCGGQDAYKRSPLRNNRDCIHGRQAGKCVDCDIHMLEEEVKQIKGLKFVITDQNEVIESLKSKIKELESTPTGKAPCIKFCEATAFKSRIAALERDKEKLKGDVAKAGVRAREEMQPRWVSVDDRLPVNLSEITTGGGMEALISAGSRTEFCEITWGPMPEPWINYDGINPKYVTHWMPKPEPFK